MKLVGVVFDQPTITTTLRALGLPLRAPPIAPARSRQWEDCDNSNDWSGTDVQTTPDKRGIITIRVHVSSISQLRDIHERLEALDGVIHVERLTG